MSMSEAQKVQLLAFMEQYPELCNNRTFQPGETKQDRRKKWEEIAACLNALGGIVKTGPGWQVLWRNWRYRVRRNARASIANIQSTGGGGGTAIHEGTEPGEEGTARVIDVASCFQGMDARVMALVGWDTVAGVSGGVDLDEDGVVHQPMEVAQQEVGVQSHLTRCTDS